MNRCPNFNKVKYSHSFSYMFINFYIKIKIITCSKAIQMSPYVFLQKPCFNLFYLVLKKSPLIDICIWCEVTLWFSLPHGYPVGQALSTKNLILFYLTAVWLLSGDCKCVNLFLDSVLFHSSVYLPLHLYHTISINTVL